MDAALKDSVDCNVSSVESLVHLCKKMKDLKALIYVSTAYSNCTRYLIEEKMYEPPIKPKLLIGLVRDLDADTLQEITPG